MGRLHYLDVARLVILSTAMFSWWSSVHGIAYPKYFWDMIGGTLGPTGWIPPPQAKVFVALIVDFPAVQIFNLITGFMVLALEWPLPFLKGTALYRSYAVRMVAYAVLSFTNFLVYQSVDPGFFYFCSILLFLKAKTRGEEIGGKAKPVSAA